MADIAFPGVLTPGFGNTFVVRPIAPIVTTTGALTLDYVTHTGHIVRVDNTVTIPDTLTDGFTCLVENTSSAAITVGVSGSLSLEGTSRVGAGEAVQIFKTGAQAISLLTNPSARSAGGFPPTTFESVTVNRVLVEADDQLGVLVVSPAGIEVTLPATSTLAVGWYVLVVNNSTGATAITVELDDPTTEVMAGEPGGFDLLSSGETAVYVYVSATPTPTFQKVVDGQEQVIPPWPLSGTTVTTGSPLTITGGSWNQTYRETVVQGQGNITLPDLTLAPVVQGSGIRLIATGASGLGVNVFDSSTQSIRGEPDPATVSPDLSITQGNEVILVVLSTTEWGIFYEGTARPVAAPVTTLQAGVFSWAGLSRNINTAEIQTVLDGLQYVRSQTAIDFANQIAEVDNIVPGNSAVADTRVDIADVGSPPATSDFGALESSSTSNRNGFIYARLPTSRANDEFAVVVRDTGGQIVPDPEDENAPFVRRFDQVGVFSDLGDPPGDATYDVFRSVTNAFIRADDTARVEALTINDHYTLSNLVRIRDENHEADEAKLTEASFADSVLARLNNQDGLTQTERIVVDSVTVEQDDTVPANDLNGLPAGDLLWKFGSPSHLTTDYVESDTLPPFDDRQFTVAIRRPAEIARAEFDDTPTLTQRQVFPIEPSLLADFSMYSLNSGTVPATATELVLLGGTRTVHAIRPSSQWVLPGGQLLAGEVTREDLDDDVREHLVTDEERQKLNAIELLTVNNSAAADVSANITVRAAYFFDEPSTAPIAAFPSNEAANTSGTATANLPALTGLTTDLDNATGGILTGPGLAGGLTGGPAGVGFDITSSSNVLDLTDNLAGVLIMCTVDPSAVTADDVIWDAASSAIALVWTTANRFVLRVERDSATPTTSTRGVRPVMPTPDGNERPTVSGSTAGSTTEVYFEVPSNATTTGTALRLEVYEYEDGSFADAHAADFDVTTLNTDQVLGNVPTQYVGNVAMQYLAAYTGAGGSRRVLRATLTVPANSANHSWQLVAKAIFTETVNVPGSTVDYDITEGFNFQFLPGRRYTVAVHLFAEAPGPDLEFQIAINGQQGDTAIQRLGSIHVTEVARFQNPTIQIGGTTRDFTGALQKILVAKLRPGYILHNTEIAAISGRSAQAFYGLQVPIGERRDLVASNIVWEGEFNSGNLIDTAGERTTVNVFDVSSADSEGRPGLPAIVETDVTQGRYDLLFVVGETVGANTYYTTVSAADVLTDFTTANRFYGRMRFNSVAVTPTGGEIVVTPTSIRMTPQVVAARFNDGDITIRMYVVRRF